MLTLFVKKVLIILRYCQGHAQFWLEVQFPLKFYNIIGLKKKKTEHHLRQLLNSV